MLEAVGEVFLEAGVLSVLCITHCSKANLVAKMLKAIHAQESEEAVQEK